MSIRDHLWNAVQWKVMKDQLGYTDEEMNAFRENPRNEDVLSKAPALLDKVIVLEVVELFYAGVDPNNMRFKRAACFDVGVQCGGWGRIALELSVQDRKDAGR